MFTTYMTDQALISCINKGEKTAHLSFIETSWPFLDKRVMSIFFPTARLMIIARKKPNYKLYWLDPL